MPQPSEYESNKGMPPGQKEGRGDSSDETKDHKASHRLTVIAIWAAGAFLVFRFFGAAKFLLLGGLMATSLAAAFRPIFRRLPGPTSLRGLLMAAVVLTVILGSLFAIGWTLYEPIRENIQRLPELRKSADAGLRHISDKLGLEESVTIDALAQTASELLTGGSPAQAVPTLTGTIIDALLGVLVVIIAAAYMLTRRSDILAERFASLLSPPRGAATIAALDELQPQLRWWLLGTLLNMTAVGVISGTGYWIIGLKLTLPLAILAGLTESVPTLGPVVALIVSLLVAVTQGTGQVIGVVIVYVIVHSMEVYLLTPLIMQRAVHIPPVVTLFTVILWGNVFGAAGLILAIPIDLSIWALLRKHVIEWNAPPTPTA